MRWALIAFLIPFAAVADPTLECSDAGSQVEIGACVSDMEARVNQAVAESYSFALAAAQELDEVTDRVVAQPALEAAQAAWEAYRDTQCEAVGAWFGGGSGTGIGITSCRVDLGRERVDELLRMTN
ncbi:lysozyme inhibitor LprI family protein [Ruegeria arenilitoris]|uniref:lysozyme inhibitor LprI family protein n=1 Tax=Ruegeria arenilitoris TaxID=1173585 RepID=UPI001479CE1E|nr:lysozyme inhibitor LprI family protein [Ruegeria arenilitoris]